MIKFLAFIALNLLSCVIYGQLYSVQHPKHVFYLQGELAYFSLNASNNKAINSSVRYNPTGYQGFGLAGTLLYEFNANPTWGFSTGIGLDHTPEITFKYFWREAIELNKLVVPIRILYRATTSFALESGVDLGIPLSFSPEADYLELSNLETSVYLGMRLYTQSRWFSTGIGYKHGLTEWGKFTGKIENNQFENMAFSSNAIILNLRFRIVSTAEKKVEN